MQTQRAEIMHKLGPEKGILGHNSSLALLRVEKKRSVTFGSMMIKQK